MFRRPHRPHRALTFTALVFCAGCSLAWWRGEARAQSADVDANAHGPEWKLGASLGGGSYESALPAARGKQRVARAPYPALGIELGVLTRPDAALRFAGSATYATSLGYELARTIVPDTSERSAARKQELRAQAGAELTLDLAHYALVVPFALGYDLRALTTDVPLVFPAAYALSGPYVQTGVRAPLFGGRFELAALGELGAVLAASEALDRGGASGPGYAYAVVASASLRLSALWEARLGYRETHAVIPLSTAGSFRDQDAWLFASVVLHP